MNIQKIKTSSTKSLKWLIDILPILIGIILLVSMINNLVPKSFFNKIFTWNGFADSFIGAWLWSILTWNPITWYILWKWFLNNWISLVAVTAFLVAWTTVWIIQLPAESLVLWKKFAIYRNISAFFMAIIVAIITVYIYNFIK